MALVNTEKFRIMIRSLRKRAMSRNPPFSPQTGNPEAHDYLDWYRYLLRTGQIAEPLAEEKAAASTKPESTKPQKPDTP